MELISSLATPFLIFCARICDVSIGTLRIMMVARGHKNIAPVLGFFEVTIWLLAISQIIRDLTAPINYIAYGAGFAAGTYLGMYFERKLSLGVQLLRIITSSDANDVVDYLRTQKHGFTYVDANGSEGPVKIIFTIVHRKDIQSVIEQVRLISADAFYSVQDVEATSGGSITARRPATDSLFFPPIKWMWKG